MNAERLALIDKAMQRFIDPAEELIGILMTQVRPYGHLTIRQKFLNLAYQAIED